MNQSRRNMLGLLSTGLVTGMAGCSSLAFGGKQKYAPVIFDNRHDSPHMMTVSVTTIPGEGAGFTKYFTDTYLVGSGNKEKFDQGLAFTDYAPELMVLIVLENGISKRAQFTFDLELTELRILINQNGTLEVKPRTQSPSA